MTLLRRALLPLIALVLAAAASLAPASARTAFDPTATGRLRAFDPIAAAPTAPYAPAYNWRLPIVGPVTDSAGDATVPVTVQGSSLAHRHALVPLSLQQTRTITIPVAAVSAPGGLVYVNTDRQDGAIYQTSIGLGATAAVAQSFDGGTSWTTAAVAQGGNLDQGRSWHLPTGPPSLVRIALTNANTAALNTYLGVFQRPTLGRPDIWLAAGASFEDFGGHPRRLTNALQSAYPFADPVIFNTGVSGSTTGQVSARALTDLPNYPLAAFVHLNAGGNSLNPRPITPVNGDFAGLKGDITAMVSAARAAGMLPFSGNISYRDLANPYVADNTIPANGPDPVNKGVLYPLYQSILPHLMDPALGVARSDQYGLFLALRASILNPGDQHPGDGYVALDAMEAQTFGAFVYGRAWPVSVYEQRVAAFEAAPSITAKNAAYELVQSLPDGPAKIGFQSRLSAVSVALPVNSALPTITGTAAVGSPLVLAPGTWSNTPLRFDYTVTREDGTVVQTGVFARIGIGATATYTPGGADQGHTLTLNATATNGQGQPTAAVSSVATAAVAAPTGQSSGGLTAANTFPFAGSSDAVAGPNLFADTDTVDTAAWTRSGLATPATGQADTRNGFTAVKLAPANDSGNNLRRFSKSSTGLTAGALYQDTIEVRGTGDATKGGRYLYYNAGSTAQGQIAIDTLNGTFSTPPTGVQVFATNLGGTNWRFSVQAAPTGSSRIRYWQINNANTAADTTYPGDGTSGIVVTKVYFAKVS